MAAVRHHVRLLAPAVSRYVRQMSGVATTFKYDDIQIDLTKNPMPKPDPDNLVFGAQFSDHMLEIDWAVDKGWEAPRITPLHNFSMHPAAKVFHYAIELYEGLKAYRGPDGRIRIFRPDLNMERMNITAARSTFPTFDGEELIKCMKKLISIDKEWVPYSTTSTLYVRPTMIATEAGLGVSKPLHCKLFVITGPVGPYYPTGFKPVSLLADPRHVRAWEGGCGAFKMGANYAPTIHTQIEALSEHNCQQVLWLYGDDHKVTEVGTMNFFMFWVNEKGEKELLTPGLDRGVILPGVTRRSLLDMAQEWNEFKVTERFVNMHDIKTALNEGRVLELFGAGTACVVCPIEKIVYAGEELHIPTMEQGAPITMRFHKELTDIQFGRRPSPWAVDVEFEDDKADDISDKSRIRA